MCCCDKVLFLITHLASYHRKHIDIGAAGLGSIPELLKLDTVSPAAHHRCGASLELVV